MLLKITLNQRLAQLSYSGVGQGRMICIVMEAAKGILSCLAWQELLSTATTVTLYSCCRVTVA